MSREFLDFRVKKVGEALPAMRGCLDSTAFLDSPDSRANRATTDIPGWQASLGPLDRR
jgi:hypothetical protein